MIELRRWRKRELRETAREREKTPSWELPKSVSAFDCHQESERETKLNFDTTTPLSCFSFLEKSEGDFA